MRGALSLSVDSYFNLNFEIQNTCIISCRVHAESLNVMYQPIFQAHMMSFQVMPRPKRFTHPSVPTYNLNFSRRWPIWICVYSSVQSYKAHYDRRLRC